MTAALRKSLRSWRRSDTVLLWAWAFFVAGAVALYEIYFNNYNQHPGTWFWTDRVPFYFALTLVFTGVVFALSKLLPWLRGWLGLLVISVAVSILFAATVSSTDASWWLRLEFARNVIILTTVYQIPPFMLATVMHWRAAATD